jgi:hypothetical protein
MPVLKSFVHDPNTANSLYVTDFYKFLGEARMADNSLKRLSGEEADAYYAKHKDAVDERRGADQVARQLADLRRDNDHIRRSGDLSREERQAAIAENNAMIRFLSRDFMRQARPVSK